MKELILAILIACSLVLSGCTENQQNTRDKQLDDTSNTKTKEKVEKTKLKKEVKNTNDKKENLKEPEKKAETKNSKSKTVKENESDPQSDEEVARRVSERNIVVGECIMCNKTISRNDVAKDDGESLLCKSCYNKGYRKCLNCGKIANGYDKGTSCGSTGILCEECTEKYLEGEIEIEYCTKCGKKLETDEMNPYVHDDNGNIICLNCYFAEHDQIGDSDCQ